MAAADSAMPGGPGKEMDISKVNPQQLQQLHQSLEQEIQNLNVSFQTLQTVNAKFKVHSKNYEKELFKQNAFFKFHFILRFFETLLHASEAPNLHYRYLISNCFPFRTPRWLLTR